jgi:transcription initiation factor TFIIF subunit beta
VDLGGIATSMAAHVKQEPGSTPYIKPDPDSSESPAGALSDEDIYEDAGDLDFSQASQNVWLTRIPRPLWEHWSKLDDDEEIQIGTVRVEGDPTDIKRVCLNLSPVSLRWFMKANLSLQVSLRLNEHPRSKDIPKDYTLKRQNVSADSTSFAVQNSFIFTERDLPGHKNRVDVVFGEARSLLYESIKREARKKSLKKKWEPYVRRTIPSTSTAGRIQI